MGRTKDERYILCAFETANQAGNLQIALDRYDIGTRIGLSQKAVNVICRLLAQANFIKILSKSDIRLTTNGTELVESLKN